MAIVARHDTGKRYTATVGDYTIFAGKAHENPERNAMWPGQLFIAALGMCMVGDIVPFCERHDIPTEDVTLELDVTNAEDPSRAESVAVTIHLPGEVSRSEQKAIIRAAKQCYIRQSIINEMEIDISVEQ
ncbi:MAG: OsmC family protein [Armatimonadota bacterium]